ncbi:MAG: beta-ketoacyl synthase N-terminal-like domain-containing protein, partial [Bacteroidota bacterium]
MKGDIAIIGISGRFPEAENLEEFYQNLKTGKDAARALSKERKCKTTMDLQANYQDLSYIEGIHHFDHRFFNISLDEAEKMDPRQRILLEEVHRAIESAGYAPSQLSNTNTAIYMADAELDYYHHAEQFSPVLFAGNLNPATAGRLARHFQLRGSTLMVDTACSSSLVALHLGLRELQNKEADTCLVATASLHLFPAIVNSEIDMGVSSADGHTRSFSEDADGSGAGESIVCVLLKRLEDAQRDRDLIYAVIKGSSVNQDAHLSGSLTAPSSNAQKEVITDAWKKSEIDPTSITYVEAHGSATRLGDPIEIDGLNMAFRAHTKAINHCAVSSVKSNIGHTGTSAGLSGLAKVVLALQHAELFPAVNFKQANPFIDFEDSAVYINQTLKKWVPNNGTPLRAGISSFGLSGTNCHVVLEQAPMRKERTEVAQKGMWLLPITAKSKEALVRNREALRLYLQKNDHLRIADVSYTLCQGRDHYPHRMTILASNLSEAISALSEPASSSYHLKKEYRNLIFLFADQWTWKQQELEAFAKLNQTFNQHWQSCLALIEVGDRQPLFYQFAGQYALYHCLTAEGVETNNLLGVGLGELVVETLLGERTLADGLQAAIAYQSTQTKPLEEQKLIQLIKVEAKSPTLFFNLGPASDLSNLLLKIQKKQRRAQYQVQSIEELGEKTLAAVLGDLFMQGFVPRWEKVFPEAAQRCLLPHYQFDKTHCWIKPPLEWKETDEVPLNIEAPAPAKEFIQRDLSIDEFPESWSLTEKKVAAIWVELLKLTEPLTLEDDFFKLGGQSLYTIQMMIRIKIDFGVEIGFQDAFKWSTVAELAKVIDQAEKVDLDDFTTKIVRVPIQEYYDVTPNQSRLWFLDKFDEEKLNYLLTLFNLLEGNIDKDIFDKALEAFARRHESIRTVFIDVDGTPKQKVLPYEECGVGLEFIDLREEEDREG